MRLFRYFAVGWMLLCCATGQAQTDAATAERLVRESGLWDQIGALSTAMPSAFVQGTQQVNKPPSEAETARLRQRAEQAFAADRLQRAATQAVAEGAQPQHILRVLAWYASSTGQAVRKAEVAITAEHAGVQPEVLVRLGHELWSQMPAARRQLLSELIVTMRVAEAMLQITENSMIAMQRGLALASPELPLPSAEQMRKGFRAQRPVMLKTFHEMAQSSMALTYRQLPDQMLRDYLAYSRSPAGRHFNDLGMQAFDQAFSASITSLVESLAGTRDNQNI
jgi:hypothetical protein